MQIHQIKPKNKLKKSKRIGRGGKKGTYSGRGVKGQLSRSGHKKAPAIREVIKKYHKLRGYRFSSTKTTENVKVSDLQKKFAVNEVVSPKTLLEKGLVRRRSSVIKILGNGSLNKKLMVREILLSQSAIKKIEEAGGKVIQKRCGLKR